MLWDTSAPFKMNQVTNLVTTGKETTLIATQDILTALSL